MSYIMKNKECEGGVKGRVVAIQEEFLKKDKEEICEEEEEVGEEDRVEDVEERDEEGVKENCWK